MNFHNIYLLCKQNINTISSLKADVVTDRGIQVYRVKDWRKILNSLLMVRQVKALEDYVNKYINSVPEIHINKDSFKLDINDWNSLQVAMNELKKQMQTIIRLFESLNGDKPEGEIINVKIPYSANFDDFASDVDKLNKIFSQCPLLNDKDERIEFYNVDIGSTWLTFVVVGIIAIDAGSRILNNLAALIDKVIIIQSHEATYNKQKQELEESKRTEQEKNTIRKFLKESYEKEFNLIMDELKKADGKELQPEDEARLKQSLQWLNDLIDKGMVITASFDSNDNTKALFEPLKESYLTDNVVSLITDKNKKE